jgi:multisubunit Na+/H+ antiporter MnhF subunit
MFGFWIIFLFLVLMVLFFLFGLIETIRNRDGSSFLGLIGLMIINALIYGLFTTYPYKTDDKIYTEYKVVKTNRQYMFYNDSIMSMKYDMKDYGKTDTVYLNKEYNIFGEYVASTITLNDE